jgi:hypothetical protein
MIFNKMSIDYALIKFEPQQRALTPWVLPFGRTFPAACSGDRNFYHSFWSDNVAFDKIVLRVYCLLFGSISLPVLMQAADVLKIATDLQQATGNTLIFAVR